jgi:hypothetical protein
MLLQKMSVVHFLVGHGREVNTYDGRRSLDNALIE